MHIEEVIRLADRIDADLRNLRDRSPAVVMFADLVGSTQFKIANPAEEVWLPRVARFLAGVTRIVTERGRVVKYIGDEVMALFSGSNAQLAAEQAAENILAFCEQIERDEFQAKIAIDYGDVSLLSYSYSAPPTEASRAQDGDPQGTVVDRCARLASKAVAGAVLCSREYREASRTPDRWVAVGSFTPRGFAEPIDAYMLQTRGAPSLAIEDERMSLPDCLVELEKVRAQLAEAQRFTRR